MAPHKKKMRNFIDLTGDDQEEDERKPAAMPRGSTVFSAILPTTTQDIAKDAALAVALFESEQRKGEKSHDKAVTQASIKEDFLCPVCLDPIDDVKYQTYAILKCHHRFCFVCLEQLVKTSSSVEYKPASIRCPFASNGCSEVLSLADIQLILQYNPKTMSMYSEATSLAFLEQQVVDGNARRCPSKKCNYTFEYEPATPPDTEGPAKKRKKKVYLEGCDFDCPECKSKFCLDCGANQEKVGPPHDGTCEEHALAMKGNAQERQQLKAWTKLHAHSDAQFRSLLKREAKRGKSKACPKCFQPITKNKGCDHMQCRCGNHFSWKGAPNFKC